MPSFHKLATKAAAEQGQVLQLNGPDGTPCGEWVRVRGIDSDVFARANRGFRRALLIVIEEHPPEWRKTEDYQAHTEAEQRKLQSSLVMEWSFDEPCTPENILDLFTEAPYIAEQVDTFAGKREKFVTSSSTNSEPSPSSKSSSPSPSGSTESHPPSASTSSKSQRAEKPAVTQS